MTEILTESYCERCGNRFTFESATRTPGPFGRARVFARGLRNYLTSDESLDEAIADARRDRERQASGLQLQAFHDTFSFCFSCRQYTCRDCWNEAAGKCRSCAPLAGVPDPLELQELATAADSSESVGTEAPADVLDIRAWPTPDLAADAALPAPDLLTTSRRGDLFRAGDDVAVVPLEATASYGDGSVAAPTAELSAPPTRIPEDELGEAAAAAGAEVTPEFVAAEVERLMAEAEAQLTGASAAAGITVVTPEASPREPGPGEVVAEAAAPPAAPPAPAAEAPAQLPEAAFEPLEAGVIEPQVTLEAEPSAVAAEAGPVPAAEETTRAGETTGAPVTDVAGAAPAYSAEALPAAAIDTSVAALAEEPPAAVIETPAAAVAEEPPAAVIETPAAAVAEEPPAEPSVPDLAFAEPSPGVPVTLEPETQEPIAALEGAPRQPVPVASAGPAEPIAEPVADAAVEAAAEPTAELRGPLAAELAPEPVAAETPAAASPVVETGPEPREAPAPAVQAPPLTPAALAPAASAAPGPVPAAPTARPAAAWQIVAPDEAPPPVPPTAWPSAPPGRARGGSQPTPVPSSPMGWLLRHRDSQPQVSSRITRSVWEESSRELVARPGIGVQACQQCSLPLSASARFCRRCGARQG